MTSHGNAAKQQTALLQREEIEGETSCQVRTTISKATNRFQLRTLTLTLNQRFAHLFSKIVKVTEQNCHRCLLAVLK